MLTVQQIKDTDTPLSQFLKANKEERLQIAKVFQTEKYGSQQRVIQMLSQADAGELSTLKRHLSEMDTENHRFLTDLKKAIPVREMLLSLPTHKEPHKVIIGLMYTEEGEASAIKFGRLFNAINKNQAESIAEKIVKQMSISDVAEMIKGLNRINHSMQAAQPPLLEALASANSDRIAQHKKQGAAVLGGFGFHKPLNQSPRRLDAILEAESEEAAGKALV